MLHKEWFYVSFRILECNVRCLLIKHEWRANIKRIEREVKRTNTYLYTWTNRLETSIVNEEASIWNLKEMLKIII